LAKHYQNVSKKTAKNPLIFSHDQQGSKNQPKTSIRAACSMQNVWWGWRGWKSCFTMFKWKVCYNYFMHWLHRKM